MTNINDHKKAYLDYKEKLLADIKYYEKSIEDFRANDKNNNFYDENSSDSEDDWLSAKDMLPKAIELKRQQNRLRTYLQATQELTGLTVLQFEINVLVREPKIEGEPVVEEAGTWREVAAECRADLVPFSITFYVHTPDRKFGQPSYRGVRVVLVKPTHEAELANSVLHTLTRPSDAVEVVRSYAAAYRSRRTTLARLANKYANTLLMEPHTEGGFVLKCANLLEVVWRLENKWSPVAPFHHKMKFDLEYMEESYIKIISQCHKQLSDPSIQTDERTLLLAKIITTCLEASPEPHEAVDSDLESKATDCDLKRDSEVMAPPKSLPKKGKTRNSANTSQTWNNDGSKRLKGDHDDDNSSNEPNLVQKSSNNIGVKRMKSTNNNNDDICDGKRSINDGSKRMKTINNKENAENSENSKNIPSTAQKRSINDNIDEYSKRIKSNDNIKHIKAIGNAVNDKINQNKDSNIENINKDSNTKNKIDKSKRSIATAKKSANTTPKTAEVNENTVANTKNADNNKNKANTKISSNSKDAKKPDDITAKAKNKTKVKNEASTKILINSAEEKTAAGQNVNNEEANTKNKLTKDKNKTKPAVNTKTLSNTKDTNEIINKIDSNIENKDKNDIKSVANTKNATDSANTEKLTQNTNDKLNANAKNATEKQTSVAKTKNVAKNDNLKVAKSKTSASNDPKSAARLKSNANVQERNENVPKNNSNDIMKKATERNLANTKIKDKIANMQAADNNMNDTHTFNSQPEKIISGNLTNKYSKNISLRTGNIRASNKIFKAGNTEKENGGRTSKIPQKKLTPISEKSIKSNPLRISPRTLPSKFKTLSNQNIAKTTSIPIFKKSVPKH